MNITIENNRSASVTLSKGSEVKLEVEGVLPRTCVYVTMMNEKITITGGSSIIESISGKGMLKKFKE